MLTGCRSTDETTLIVLPNPFPVELLFFEAEADDRSKQVDISWATLSETNNDHFIIQRSKDGRDWEEIIEVQGAGTSVSEIRYSTEDRNPHHGVSYYRLKQVNDDGKTTHSSIRAVTFDLPYSLLRIHHLDLSQLMPMNIPIVSLRLLICKENSYLANKLAD